MRHRYKLSFTVSTTADPAQLLDLLDSIADDFKQEVQCWDESIQLDTDSPCVEPTGDQS